MTEPTDEREGPVVRDKRRIDPETGEVRETAPAQAGAVSSSSWAAEDAAAAQVEGDLARLESQLEERTADVQRVQAEYANYRKRVDRDREQVRDLAVGAVLGELLTLLDDIDRAREHDELTGGFKSVAETLEATVTKLGLERYGSAGEPFDPTVHEALTHTVDDSVTETTAIAVLQPGYRFAGRILRPARVAVADPPA
jgi:molecular chaperone GrpE